MEVEDDMLDDQSNIQIKRPFAVKMIKQLNCYQSDVYRKSRRKNLKSMEKKCQTIIDRFRLKDTKERDPRLSEVLKNGNRIIACWRNKQIHGDAEIYYNNGSYFKGIYQNGIKTRGHFKFPSGFEYIGHCFGNRFEGEGVLIYPNGKIIEGNWHNSQIVGNGKIQYPRGEVYYGEIRNFKKNGKGYLYLNDGSKYEGEFKDGLITGKGTYFEQGKIVAEGVWMNGELQEEFALDLDQESIGISLLKNQKEPNLSEMSPVKNQEIKKQPKKQELTTSKMRRTRPGDRKEAKKVQFN